MSEPIVKVRLRIAGVKLGAHGKFYGSPVVHRYRGSTIRLGTGVEFRSWQTSNVLGLAHRVILTTTSKHASIEVGDGVGMSGTTVCAAERVAIGANTLIGADVIITDNDHHPIYGGFGDKGIDIGVAPVVIGAGVFVGARAIILKGSHIGEGAVIGAGAVVAGDVAPFAVVVGNPARPLGRPTRRTSPLASQPGDNALEVGPLPDFNRDGVIGEGSGES